MSPAVGEVGSIKFEGAGDAGIARYFQTSFAIVRNCIFHPQSCQLLERVYLKREIMNN